MKSSVLCVGACCGASFHRPRLSLQHTESGILPFSVLCGRVFALFHSDKDGIIAVLSFPFGVLGYMASYIPDEFSTTELSDRHPCVMGRLDAEVGLAL